MVGPGRWSHGTCAGVVHPQTHTARSQDLPPRPAHTARAAAPQEKQRQHPAACRRRRTQGTRTTALRPTSRTASRVARRRVPCERWRPHLFGNGSQDAGPVGAGRLAPAASLVGGRGGRHRRVHVVRISRSDAPDDLLRGGVDDFQVLAGAGRHPAAVDEQLPRWHRHDGLTRNTARSRRQRRAGTPGT